MSMRQICSRTTRLGILPHGQGRDEQQDNRGSENDPKTESHSHGDQKLGPHAGLQNQRENPKIGADGNRQQAVDRDGKIGRPAV